MGFEKGLNELTPSAVEAEWNTLHLESPVSKTRHEMRTVVDHQRGIDSTRNLDDEDSVRPKGFDRCNL